MQKLNKIKDRKKIENKNDSLYFCFANLKALFLSHNKKLKFKTIFTIFKRKKLNKKI
jgi:hypothetical protein